MMHRLYRAVTTLGGPLIRIYLWRRMAKGKEDRARFSERLGIAGRPRPKGAVVWVHAASVGESLSSLPLIEAILARYPNIHVLVTTGTVTSAALMAERLPDRATHQYVPVDRVSYVGRFLDHWRPNLALWMESEFWPNLIWESSTRGLPMVLVNGRVSPKSFESWQRHPKLIAKLLSGFALCLGQTDGDAERLAKMGAPRTACVGNLKGAAPPLPVKQDDLANLKAAVGDRPRWLAASTHQGEERTVWHQHQRIAERHPQALTVIVPRHPNRGDEIAQALRAEGAIVAQRSKGETITEATQVYVADTLGELGLFFRLCPIVFMGKSLVPLGGQNPMEPARLGAAVLYGPHMTNFREMTASMDAAKAAQRVADADALGNAVSDLMADAVLRQRWSQGAFAFAEAEADVLDRLMAILAPELESAHAHT